MSSQSTNECIISCTGETLLREGESQKFWDWSELHTANWMGTVTSSFEIDPVVKLCLEVSVMWKTGTNGISFGSMEGAGVSCG